MCVRELFSPCSSVVNVFLSYIVLIFHISRLTQDKITMPQPPHTHRNHPPITPHPKTVFLSDLSVCITDSSEGTPVAQHSRNAELSTISEIPEIPNSPPPPPSNASPPHAPLQTSTTSYTYTYDTDPRSLTSLPHSPEHITVTPHVHDHSYASLPHPPSKQTDAIMKVCNWMNDGSVCSNSSSSCEAETAASAPAPATYAEVAAASPTQPALAMASPIHSPTHSNTYTLPASSCQAQTILIDNITTKHTRAEIEIKLRPQFPGVRYALTFLKRRSLALVLETPKEIHSILKQIKWDEDFFGKDLYIHLANKDARPWLCVNKVPPTMELAKGICRIDPVEGMEHWEIIIKGLGRLRDTAGPLQSSERSGS